MVSELVLLRPASVPTDEGFYVEIGKARKKESIISDLKAFISRRFNFPHPQVSVDEDGGVTISGLYDGIPEGADYSHEVFDHILDLVGWIEGRFELPISSESVAPEVFDEMPQLTETSEVVHIDEQPEIQMRGELNVEKRISCLGARQVFTEMSSTQTCHEQEPSVEISKELGITKQGDLHLKIPAVTVTLEQHNLKVDKFNAHVEFDEHIEGALFMSSDEDQDDLKVLVVDELKDMVPFFDPGGGGAKAIAYDASTLELVPSTIHGVLHTDVEWYHMKNLFGAAIPWFMMNQYEVSGFDHAIRQKWGMKLDPGGNCFLVLGDINLSSELNIMIACMKLFIFDSGGQLLQKFIELVRGFKQGDLCIMKIEVSFIASGEVLVRYPPLSRLENICKYLQNIFEIELQIILASGCSARFVVVLLLLLPQICNATKWTISLVQAAYENGLTLAIAGQMQFYFVGDSTVGYFNNLKMQKHYFIEIAYLPAYM